MKRIALIPAYMPDQKMIHIAQLLYAYNFEVIIVNDGSSEDYNNVFKDVSKYAIVLNHEINKGKGEALKTGMSFIKSYFYPPYTVVNVDADGQHQIEDILHIVEVSEHERSSLILGSRKMEGKVPAKSRLGNAITRFVYRLSTGINVYDTQTGLRAFSDELIERLLIIDGSRYEYEMNMLMELPREGIEIKEIWINTVYINDNKSSHFNPIKDSFKIYKEIIKYSASSLISFIIDYIMFCLLSFFTGSVTYSNILARIVSGTVNYNINKKYVFESKSGNTATIKYILLAVFILLCNTLILNFLTLMNLPAYAAKILTEVMLFFFSYFIQHKFIFRGEKENQMKKNLWKICSTVTLLAFTTYISLDTFVISRGYDTNATGMNTEMFAELENTDSALSEEETSSDKVLEEDTNTSTSVNTTNTSESTSKSKHKKGSNKSSEDTSEEETTKNTESTESIIAADYNGDSTISTDNYTITLSEYYQNDTKIYVADVTLSSAQYLKTAFANDTYGKNVTATTSSIASSNGAIFAINGDYYGVQESGYVIRNGIVYRDTPNGSDILCIYADGTMEVVNDSEYTAEELVSMGVWQAFSFGPALLEDGEIAVDVNTEVDKAKTSNPRTAIGIIDANHFIFVVSDGRTTESEGLSLYELAEFMQELGAETAYNLDGGGSSTMYFNGSVINNPTSGGSIKERSVSDIVYI